MNHIDSSIIFVLHYSLNRVKKRVIIDKLADETKNDPADYSGHGCFLG